MRWMNWRFEGGVKVEAEITVDQLPPPRPSFIELAGDAFIRNPHLKDNEANLTGIDQLLAMSATERLEWHESWRQFIRRCERRGWTAEMIAATVWGDTRVDEPR
jgi:hypothetical protein